MLTADTRSDIGAGPTLRRKTLLVADLFCGAGGSSTGGAACSRNDGVSHEPRLRESLAGGGVR